MVNKSDIKEYFDARACTWDDKAGCEPETLETILDLAEIMPGDKVLEIGCGTGILFDYILKRSPSVFTAIDISEAMIKIARRKYANSPIQLIAGDFYNTALPLPSYDVAIIHNAYPHFLDKTGFAEKLAATVSSGGRFIVAHSHGRNFINNCHNKDARPYSFTLGTAEEESLIFCSYFKIDILIDLENLYVISGIR